MPISASIPFLLKQSSTMSRHAHTAVAICSRHSWQCWCCTGGELAQHISAQVLTSKGTCPDCMPRLRAPQAGHPSLAECMSMGHTLLGWDCSSTADKVLCRKRVPRPLFRSSAGTQAGLAAAGQLGAAATCTGKLPAVQSTPLQVEGDLSQTHHTKLLTSKKVKHTKAGCSPAGRTARHPCSIAVRMT